MKVTFIDSQELGVLHNVWAGICADAVGKRGRASSLRRFIHALITLKLIDPTPVHYIGMGTIPAGDQGLIIVQDANAPVTAVSNASLPAEATKPVAKGEQ